MTRMPDHDWKSAVAAFKRDGFEEVRTTGDHVVLWKEGLARPVVVPKYGSLPEFVVANNLRTAGISRKRYLELLGGRKHRPKAASSHS